MSRLKVIEISNKYARASFLNYGATLYKYELLQDGEFVNKVLTLDNLDDYIENGLYMNAICGPTAGRISNGVYNLNGEVTLSKNGGDHHLHGGDDSYARKYFDYSVSESKVVFTHKTSNVEYPGTQSIQITYELIGTSLGITFEADTDVDIPMNLTSHIYFSAFENNNVFENQLKLESDKRLELVNQIPNRTINEGYYKELTNIKKLDDPFILNGNSPAVIYKSEQTTLEVDTDYDCVVIYTQNFTGPEFDGINKGICFETQLYPNGINIKGYNAVLKAGEHYKHRTTYTFRR